MRREERGPAAPSFEPREERAHHLHGMNVLVVSQAEVKHLLPMAEAIAVMEDAFRALAQGQALLPLRQVLLLPDGRGAFAAMPGQLSSPPALGLKAITVFPGNHGTEYDSHQGAVLLFDTER